MTEQERLRYSEAKALAIRLWEEILPYFTRRPTDDRWERLRRIYHRACVRMDRRSGW